MKRINPLRGKTLNQIIMDELYKNRKKLPHLLKAISPLLCGLNNGFSKGDMLEEIERIEGKKLNIDFAYPVEFQHELNRIDVNTRYFVWSYEDSNFGKPLNLLERYFEAFCKALSE